MVEKEINRISGAVNTRNEQRAWYNCIKNEETKN